MIYTSFICDYRLLKEEQYRVHITVGSDRFTYNKDLAAPVVNLLETKIFINSTISDAHYGARFISADIKDYFLVTLILDPEYMKTYYKYVPQDIRKIDYLDSKVTNNDYIYIKIKKGMPGLK